MNPLLYKLLDKVAALSGAGFLFVKSYRSCVLIPLTRRYIRCNKIYVDFSYNIRVDEFELCSGKKFRDGRYFFEGDGK